MLKVRCQVHGTVDAKGRLALPAPLRRALGELGEDQLVFAFYKGAVWGWTPREFEDRVERPQLEVDPFSDQAMVFAHSVLATAQNVEVDKQGRVRLPSPLRERAGLDKDVVVNSLLNRVEIWDRQAWEDRFSTSLDHMSRTSGMPKEQA